MRTLDKIIVKMNCQYGAPRGRANVNTCKLFVSSSTGDYYQTGKIFDSAVPLDRDGYDKGGAYWGVGSQLRVSYNKDLSFIEFYRK